MGMMDRSSLRRSRLGIPGNGSGFVAEAVGSGADEIFLDLEDSLAPGEKLSARDDLIEIVESRDWTTTDLSYRINGTDTRWWYNDVIEVASSVGDQIDTLIVPKVRSPSDIKTVANLLASVETNAGLDVGSISLDAQIETAAGLNRVTDIAHASDRLTAIIFGPADYTASVGASHGATDYPGHYWHYPLSRIAHAAASADLQAIGGPYTESDNEDAFAEACQYERALGFDGKVVIHPEQVETANDVFAPDVTEAQRARDIVTAYERAGDDVAAIEGKVIDREMYRMASRILEKAREADII